jgi:hypothetical protein
MQEGALCWADRPFTLHKMREQRLNRRHAGWLYTLDVLVFEGESDIGFCLDRNVVRLLHDGVNVRGRIYLIGIAVGPQNVGIIVAHSFIDIIKKR